MGKHLEMQHLWDLKQQNHLQEQKLIESHKAPYRNS